MLRDGGQVTCWGANHGGQIGQGVTSSWFPTPTDVPGLPDMDEVAVGASFSCVRDGTDIHCWGANLTGELGTGDLVLTADPVRLGGLARVAEVATGQTAACARRTDGEVRCWGANGHGQLGSPGSNGFVPRVVAGDLVATSLDMEQEIGCAVQPDGQLMCWGRVDGGDRYAPAPYADITDARIFRAGFLTSCVVRLDGTVWCWGANGNGQFGIGTRTGSETPQAVPAITDAHAVAISRAHVCIVERNGRMSCAGHNGDGEIGTGTGGGNVTTITEVGFFDDFTDVAVGYHFTCGLRATNQLFCWGEHGGSSSPMPVEVTGLPAGRIVSVDIGENGGSICVTLDIPPPTPARPTLCWNSANTFGQMGVGTFAPVVVPTQVMLHTDFSSVSASLTYTCGVRNDGRNVACWGEGLYLGDGVNDASSTPVDVADFP